MSNVSLKYIQSMCEEVGIELNGSQPHDIIVHDERFFETILKDQSIGLGESYMDGWWDCEQLDVLFERIFAKGLNVEKKKFSLLLSQLRWMLFNLQRKSRAKEVCEVHYDLGNDLYERMLGPTMVYTCGYWDYASTLEEAQIHKMELVCRKMNLKPGQRILDIGCGFGSFLKYAASNYGVEGVGVTLSKPQYDYAKTRCQDLPIEIRLEDYRDVEGQFDRIISIGMFEAVGFKNFRTYMEKCSDLLTPEGSFLLHTIGSNTSRVPNKHWVDKYIFPNGYLPSLKQIMESSEGIFRCDDVHNFGPSYDKTLLAWLSNFRKSWKALEPVYGERFRRMWEFYLLSFAGAFRSRHWQLWQVVLSKPDARLENLNEARLFP